MKRMLSVVDNNELKVMKQFMEKGRSNWAELGTLIGLSAPITAERVHKLEEAGVIKR